jgi:hypothetical protein
MDYLLDVMQPKNGFRYLLKGTGNRHVRQINPKELFIRAFQKQEFTKRTFQPEERTSFRQEGVG